jgi:hypothetical protein
VLLIVRQWSCPFSIAPCDFKPPVPRFSDSSTNVFRRLRARDFYPASSHAETYPRNFSTKLVLISRMSSMSSSFPYSSVINSTNASLTNFESAFRTIFQRQSDPSNSSGGMQTLKVNFWSFVVVVDDVVEIRN